MKEFTATQRNVLGHVYEFGQLMEDVSEGQLRPMIQHGYIVAIICGESTRYALTAKGRQAHAFEFGIDEEEP